MSSMNATHSASTPASRVGIAHARRCAWRPPGGRSAGRSPAGAARAPPAGVSLSACAPRLPPTTSRRSGPVRPSKRTAGGGDARDRRRAADCRSTSRASRACRAIASGKPTRMRSATVREHAVREARDRVRSCNASGRPLRDSPSARPGTTRSRPCRARRRACGGGSPQRLDARDEQREGAEHQRPRRPCRARRGTHRRRTRRRASAPASLPCPSRVPSQNASAPRATQLVGDGEARETRGRRCRRS